MRGVAAGSWGGRYRVKYMLKADQVPRSVKETPGGSAAQQAATAAVQAAGRTLSKGGRHKG